MKQRKPSDFIQNSNNQSKVYSTKKETEILELLPHSELNIQNCRVPFDQPIFRPEPPDIVLQGFEAFKVYELFLSFRNMDIVPRQISLEPAQSQFFSIASTKAVGLNSEKVAPGMEVMYKVVFQPEEVEDYFYNIVCVTEREKFIVPIRTIGKRGFLDIPDQIVFEEAPVRLTSTKTLLVRNVGKATAKFKINIQEPFSVSNPIGSVEPDHYMQLDVSFHSKAIGTFKSEMQVNYESGETMFVEVVGSAENINVRLAKHNINFENPITIHSQKKIQIVNRSSHMVTCINEVKFNWMLCPNEMEEQHLRAKIYLDFTHSENQNERYRYSIEDTDPSLKQKFLENKQRESQIQTFEFKNPNFTITPMSGSIWPHSTADVMVTFMSSSVGEFHSRAYCQVEGRETRLPLLLKGKTFGPQVKFAFSEFSLGEVFINTSHKYEILLENFGTISSQFSLRLSDSLFGPFFKFKPKQGTIGSGEQIAIQVIFEPSCMGTFNESFSWELEGGADSLNVSFEGEVVGPTFKFSTDHLNIPVTAYGFQHIDSLQLINTSQIPMNFNLEVLNTNDEIVQDLKLVPSSGCLLPFSSCDLEVLFLPLKLGSYSLQAVVNVDLVGNNLLHLPITASSIVPEIKLIDCDLNLGNCFLDYPYESTVILKNNSNFNGKFIIQAEDNVKNIPYSFVFENSTDVIEGNSTLELKVTTRIHRLGLVSFPIYFKILGKEENPLIFEVEGCGMGPNVSIDKVELNWGKVPVLQDHSEVLSLTNNSPIAAKFKCSLVNASEIFKISPMYGEVLPGDEFKIAVNAFLDDTLKFTDVLRIEIQSGETFEILLAVKGVGSPIVYDEGLLAHDFKDVFSNRTCSINFTMHNRGRRTQTITWTHLSSKDPAVLATQIFEVIPSRFVLKSGAMQTIFFRGQSNIALKVTDHLFCHSVTDKDPSRKLLAESFLSVNFITPVLDIFPTELKFVSTHSNDESFDSQSKELSLKNLTSLPLTIHLKCPKPFSINASDSEIRLNALDDVLIPVKFDPSYNTCRVSCKEAGKLMISYDEHPQKDYINLYSDVIFPNLSFNQKSLNFGCIPNNTEHQIELIVKNISLIPVVYTWYFLADNDHSSSCDMKYYLDIQPMHGRIEVGSSEIFYFRFYGNQNLKFNARAVCDVTGGPKYELPVSGISSIFEYSIDTNQIDFRTTSYQAVAESDLTIHNTGKGDFNYAVSIPKTSSIKDKVLVIPSQGTIVKGGKARLIVRLFPGVPEDVNDIFLLHIAHFDPQKISLTAKVYYPEISIDLPRISDEYFNSISEKVDQRDSNNASKEIDRLVLKAKTEKYYSSIKLTSIGNLETALVKSAGVRKDLKVFTEGSNVVHAQFMCDFGFVVRNSIVKKQITIRNPGIVPISLHLVKTNLQNSGFTIEPERIKNLPPGESVSFSIVFCSRSENSVIICDVPFILQMGASYLVKLRAEVCVPSISVNSDSKFDFERVLTGVRSTRTFKITNLSSIDCEWTTNLGEEEKKELKNKKMVAMLKDSKDFEVFPSSGVLRPSETGSIKVSFSPSSESFQNVSIPFKLQQNPKIYGFNVIGKGVRPNIFFEPPALSFGPVLPYCDTAEMKVSLINPTEYYFEIVSLDFDTFYKSELESLQQMEGIVDGKLYLPNRDYSMSFIEFLQENSKKRRPNAEFSSVLGDGSFGVGDLVKSPDSANVDQSFSILINGPPFSGKSALAKSIAQALGKSLLNIPEVIELANQLNSSSSNSISNSPDEEISTQPSKHNSEDTLLDKIRNILFGDDANISKGFVITGIEKVESITTKVFSKSPSNSTPLLKLLLRLLTEKQKKIYIFHLNLDAAKIKEREIVADIAEAQKELEALKVRELTEDQYDLMAESEKFKYDLDIRNYKKKLKEIEDRRRKDKRNTSEERKEKNVSRNQIPINVTAKEKSNKKAVSGSSPKPARKALEKEDKSQVNSGTKGVEKDANDESAIEDMFLCEATLKKYERYQSTFEVITAFLKEGKDTEKPVPSKTAANSKPKSYKPTQSEINPVPAVIENEPVQEDSGLEFHDINCNNIDFDAMTHQIRQLLPAHIQEVEKKPDMPPISTVLEKIYEISNIHDYSTSQKIFTISSLPIQEPENEMPVVVESAPAQIVKPIESKQDTKKINSRSPIKVVEEKILDDVEEMEKDATSLTRWILAPGEKKDLVVKFNPIESKISDISLAFEILGFNQKIFLPCKGICETSQIITDVKKIFPKLRKNKDDNTTIRGEYIISTGTFDYGPLLYNKPRDKYLDRFPENRAIFNIINPGQAELKVQFSLKNDGKGDTFFFEPPVLNVEPMKTEIVSVWAYPKSPSIIEDTFIISVKDNPEPFLFKLKVSGVKPEIEVEKRVINFEKLLVGRSERRDLRLRNPVNLPIFWRLIGIEQLGEDVYVNPTEGIIDCLDETIVQVEFRAQKPIALKKTIKLEISDVDRIGGIVQEISIQLHGESYDISMDIHFPKGLDGGIDFGTLRVGEDGKQLITMKNKGKYEVGFRMMLETNQLAEILTVSPMQGIIQPSEKPFFVQLIFRSSSEILIREMVALKCIVFEPATGEVTGSVPVKISCRAVHSKFNISPIRDLNFGALVQGSRSSKQFVIENTGEFEFKFNICKLVLAQAASVVDKVLGGSRGPTQKTKPSSPPPVSKIIHKKEVGKQSDILSLGPFSLFPTSGNIVPGTKATITVEFHADNQGVYDEGIGIDISDRSLEEFPDPIDYYLIAESCVPGINVNDFNSIFEEYIVAKRLELFNSQSIVYGEEDRCFYFGAVLVGSQVSAQFKISNPFKVPCEVSFQVKPRGKSKADSSDFAFEMESKKTTIASHEHRIVHVAFCPTAIQTYNGVFEAIVENVAEGKNKSLIFELRGDGTLPRIAIEKPVTKNKSGNGLLKFKRLLIGTSQTQSIVLKNDGVVSAKFKMEWLSKDNDDIYCNYLNEYHLLKPGEFRTIDLICQPSTVKKLEGELRVKIQDNPFEDAIIQIQGEGYMEDLTIDGFSNEGENEISFRDSTVDEIRSIPFKLTNQSSEWIKVNIVDTSEFSFSPSTMHISPDKGEKTVNVYFHPKHPIDLQNVPIPIKATKIRYVSSRPDFDWDDRMKIVKWGESKKKVTEAIIEPKVETVGPSTDYPITISAFADYPLYECEQGVIKFKTTLMFQTRVFRFPIRNSGKISFSFRFEFLGQGNDFPFSVEPESGKIKPSDVAMISISFSPYEVGNYKSTLIGKIIKSGKDSSISIPVEGVSLRPYCHFEIEDISQEILDLRTPEISLNNGVPFVLDSNTRLIGIQSCGVKTKQHKKFYILNPTSKDYDFVWKLESIDMKYFKCLTTKGMIAAGKKSEISFEFYADSLEPKAFKESLWTFSIPSHEIKIPFLIVGIALEPKIFFERSGINFKAILVDRSVQEKVRLINNESQPFYFNFSELNLYQANQQTPMLKLEPSAGYIAGNSEVIISITFTPPIEKAYNFNILCHIKKKPSALSLNIKGEGYQIHDSLSIESGDGAPTEVVEPTIAQILDFGEVQIGEKSTKRVIIHNSGRFNFDFNWTIPRNSHFSISPMAEKVIRGEMTLCEITFNPSEALCTELKATCTIQNGKSYVLELRGIGTRPLLSVNPAMIDFGCHFTNSHTISPISHEVEICNNDNREMAVEFFARDNIFFDFPRGLITLSPKEKRTITICFNPTDQGNFREIFKVEANGLLFADVIVQGEACKYHLEAEPQHVNFGATKIDGIYNRVVKIWNRSKIAAPISLGPTEGLGYLAERNIKLSAYSNLKLKPKSFINLDLKFTPNKRIPQFHQEIFATGHGSVQKLLMISGSCQGIDIRLENDTLPFGAVVHKSATVRRLQLQNLGDMGAKFSWDLPKLTKNFSISPCEGYISPGMEISLEIKFHPTEINNDIRAENVPCKVDGAERLFLTLSGMCIPQPTHTDIVKFAVAVRSKEYKGILITNRSNIPWSLCPIIENDFWSGPNVIDIEPGQSKSYEVEFHPLETLGLGEGGKHEGSIFFPLPDGAGLLYKLQGVAEKPSAITTINREIPCKTVFTEIVTVSNWLRRSQRLRVVPEFSRPDSSVEFKGHEFLDLSSLQTKEYKFTYYAYKEGVVNIRLMFRNETTQEYLLYVLNYKNLAPGVISTIEINSPIRQIHTREISIYNPLTTPVTFSGTSSNNEVVVPHSFIAIPKTETSFTIECLPLHPKETTTRIVMTSQELGLYQYDVKLNAVSAGPERNLQFKVWLGNQQTQTFRFISYAKQKTDYTCKLDSPEFTVEKTISVPAATSGGVEVGIDILYEPSRLGDIRTQLCVSSPTSGDYICPLIGHCLAPKPQGPVIVKAGTTATIQFKNVFTTTATFNFVVDNPAFIVKPSETIPSKKLVAISVGYKAGNEKTAPSVTQSKSSSAGPNNRTGRLTVTNATANFAWIYYLKYTNS